jgi:hypothetical protein
LVLIHGVQNILIQTEMGIMKKEIRELFAGAPNCVHEQVFGKVKNRDGIMSAVNHYDGCAHTLQVYHYVNTDDEGEFILASKLNKRTGKTEKTVPVSLQTLTSEIATLIAMGELKRVGGPRSGRVAAPDFDESQLEESDAEDEDESEDEDEE